MVGPVLVHSPFRSAKEVMDIRRLGAMHQTRLSFARTFIRLLSTNNWKIHQQKWDLNEQGYGVCIYQLKTPNNVYHLVTFSDYISDDDRNDRVVASTWDVTFALVAGEIDDILIADLKKNIPLQEGGRNSNKVLVLSRANKSVKIFEHVVECLSRGQQPDIEKLNQVGYILRTTAVYANGKFGAQDFGNLSDNEDFRLSFSAQMCAVYILRQFSLDWIDFLAKQRGKEKATTLCNDYKRYLGIGNATGLGMSLFLIRHPKIVDNWLSVREIALSHTIRESIKKKDKTYMIALLKRASIHLKQVYTIDDNQRILNQHASTEIINMITYIEQTPIDTLNWKEFIDINRQYSFEAQEVAISCILELYPQIVDKFQDDMNADESTDVINSVSVGYLKELIENKYNWAISIDFSKKSNQYWFWYISKNKEEPRLGIRDKDNGKELEMPLDIARQVNCLYQYLQEYDANSSLISFLINHPNFGSIVRRTWTLCNCQMGEIRANSLAKDFLPMDLLRCKLSMFGATKFDPRSDRWVRVTFFQNAPLIDEIDNEYWLFPIPPETQQ